MSLSPVVCREAWSQWGIVQPHRVILVDQLDRKIIAALRINGRATYADLGRAVGLSASSVHERVGKLETAGVITGYHAVVDPSSVGLGVTALVGIHPTDTATEDDVAAALGELDEVESCYAVAGDEAFVVKVRVATVDELERDAGPAPPHPRRRADEHDRRALDPLRGPPEQRGPAEGPGGRGVACVGVSDEKPAPAA